MIPETKAPSMRWIPLCLTAFFLFVAGSVLGINPDDDSFYLFGSLIIKPSGFLHAQDWSPLYLAWFKLLSLICPNPITRYFFSWGILVSLLALVPSWFRIASAWMYALILLGIPFLTIDPYVSLFGAAILLVGTCLILQRERAISQTAAIFCGFAFVVAFARPEFDYGVYLGAATTLAALLFERTRLLAFNTAHRPSRTHPLTLAIAVIFLAAGLFVITKHSTKPRSGIAFAQHYNMRAAEHALIPALGSWHSDYAQRRFGIDLGANANTTTATIFDFLRASPRHFLGHIADNLKDIRAISLIVVLAIFVLWPWVSRGNRRLRYASVFILLIGIPCVAASIVIYPRNHYALVLIPSLLVYVLQLFEVERRLPPRPVPVLFAGCALIWLTNIALPASRENQPTGYQVYQQQVECVREFDKTAPAEPPVFESVQILNIYFIHRRNIVDVGTLTNWSDFKLAATQQHPAWISVDDDLAQRYRITTGQLDDFLRNDLGYVAHACPIHAHLTVYTSESTTP